MKNQVIKVLTPEHGKQVVKYWKSIGVNTGKYEGSRCEKKGNSCIYCGIINNQFGSYSLLSVVGSGTTEIIELPTPSELPNIGDEILVWDRDENNTQKRIFLAYIPQGKYPVVVVNMGDESDFKNGEKVSTSLWKNWKPVPKEEIVELTIEDISAGKGVGIAPHLIRIKK